MEPALPHSTSKTKTIGSFILYWCGVFMLRLLGIDPSPEHCGYMHLSCRLERIIGNHIMHVSPHTPKRKGSIFSLSLFTIHKH